MYIIKSFSLSGPLNDVIFFSIAQCRFVLLTIQEDKCKRESPVSWLRLQRILRNFCLQFRNVIISMRRCLIAKVFRIIRKCVINKSKSVQTKKPCEKNVQKLEIDRYFCTSIKQCAMARKYVEVSQNVFVIIVNQKNEFNHVSFCSHFLNSESTHCKLSYCILFVTQQSITLLTPVAIVTSY